MYGNKLLHCRYTFRVTSVIEFWGQWSAVDFSFPECFDFTFFEFLTSLQRVTKFDDFQSQFLMTKAIQIFRIFFSFKKVFWFWHFLIPLILETLFLEMRSNFWLLIWKLVNVIIKLIFDFVDLLLVVEVMSQLTLVLKTPTLRSC